MGDSGVVRRLRSCFGLQSFQLNSWFPRVINIMSIFPPAVLLREESVTLIKTEVSFPIYTWSSASNVSLRPVNRKIRKRSKMIGSWDSVLMSSSRGAYMRVKRWSKYSPTPAKISVASMGRSRESVRRVRGGECCRRRLSLDQSRDSIRSFSSLVNDAKQSTIIWGEIRDVSEKR